MPKSFFLTLGCRMRSDRVSLANPGYRAARLDMV